MPRPKEYKKKRIFTTTFEEAHINKFEEVMRREGRSVNAGLAELMQEYLKVHGSGNPVYALEKFVDNKSFFATPAFFEKSAVWHRYLQSCSKKELNEIADKSDQIHNSVQRKIQELRYQK